MIEEIHEYFRDKLDYPAESKDTDYKAAIKFDEKSDFAAKLVKHILGFANSGGGYIIVGFREKQDRSLEPDPVITDEIKASYEVTRLCQHVEKYLLGQDRINVIIHKESSSHGVAYPIISVGRFPEYPFVCTKDYTSDSTGEVILESGQIYIRTEGARTLSVKAPAEWRQLIRECIKASKEIEAKRPSLDVEEEAVKLEEKPIGVKPEILNKSKSVITIDKGEEQFNAWLSREKENALNEMKLAEFTGGYYQFIIQVPYGLSKIDSTTLLKIAEDSELHNTGWPIGVVLTKPEYKPVPLTDGIRAVINAVRNIMINEKEFDYWALSSFGHFLFIRNIEGDTGISEEGKDKAFWFDAAIWRISEIVSYASNLCIELNLKPNDRINLLISYKGLEGRRLTVVSSRRWPFFSNRKCQVDVFEHSMVLIVDDILPGLKEQVYDVMTRLCGLFDFYKPERGIVDSIVDEFLNARK